MFRKETREILQFEWIMTPCFGNFIGSKREVKIMIGPFRYYPEKSSTVGKFTD